MFSYHLYLFINHKNSTRKDIWIMLNNIFHDNLIWFFMKNIK